MIKLILISQKVSYFYNVGCYIQKRIGKSKKVKRKKKLWKEKCEKEKHVRGANAERKRNTYMYNSKKQIRRKQNDYLGKSNKNNKGAQGRRYYLQGIC